MKRAVCLVLALAMFFTVGCGATQAKEPVPKSIYSDQAVSGMKKAIETLDAVLAFDMSPEDAEEKLDMIADALSKSSDTMDNVAGLAISNAAFYLDDLFYDAEKIKERRDGLYDSLYGE